MKILVKSAFFAAGLMVGTGPVLAQAAKPCLTPAEVKTVALALMPAVLDGVGKKCVASLPEDALLRNPEAAVFKRYREAADANRAEALTAFAKLGGEGLPPELDSKMFGELMVTMVVPMLVKEIKVKDCEPINHMVELLEPLPPENMAGAIALVLQLVNRDKGKKDSKDSGGFPMCPVADADQR